MPRAVPAATRHEIIQRHLRGQTLLQIAGQLALPVATVRDLWRAFRDGGADGLVVGYSACGQATPAYPEGTRRHAVRLKRDHPGWGAGRIRVELLESFAPADVPSARVLQRVFQRAGVNRPRRTQRPRAVVRRATAPHELWQVDAVEKARLKSGAEVSWLAVSDVFTGAVLATELSPPGPVAGAHPGAGAHPPAAGVGPLGIARAGPGRQRPPLGAEHGLAAGPDLVADRVGRRGELDPAGPAAEERYDRAW
jgi:hypothetical protein